ncbi:hypothetical protein ACFL3V_06025 [Nanoarchaeota archaeon]
MSKPTHDVERFLTEDYFSWRGKRRLKRLFRALERLGPERWEMSQASPKFDDFMGGRWWENVTTYRTSHEDYYLRVTCREMEVFSGEPMVLLNPYSFAVVDKSAVVRGSFGGKAVAEFYQTIDDKVRNSTG